MQAANGRGFSMQGSTGFGPVNTLTPLKRYAEPPNGEGVELASGLSPFLVNSSFRLLYRTSQPSTEREQAAGRPNG